jgi:hypothetical protein
MWFVFQQPEIFLEYWNGEHERTLRQSLLQRAMRGSIPPFDTAVQRKLVDSMAEPQHGGRLATQRR